MRFDGNSPFMRLIIMVFLLALSVLSCKKTLKAPAYNFELPREKLVSVLLDVYLAEAALLEYEKSYQDSMRKMFITEIFTIHKIDKVLFDTTMVQLAQFPELYKDIHSQITDSLKLKETSEAHEEATQ